jgi:hypothetical protein
MFEQRTIVDQIEIRRDGSIGVRLALIVLKDSAEISSTWHRTSIEPGQDVDATMSAVNDDITTRPALMAAPLQDGIPTIRDVVALIHTPALVAAFAAKKELK